MRSYWLWSEFRCCKICLEVPDFYLNPIHLAGLLAATLKWTCLTLSSSHRKVVTPLGDQKRETKTLNADDVLKSAWLSQHAVFVWELNKQGSLIYFSSPADTVPKNSLESITPWGHQKLDIKPGLTDRPWRQGNGLCCHWSWPWCPSEVSHWL